MKNLSILISIFLLLSGLNGFTQNGLTDNAQSKSNEGVAIIKWGQTTHDFKTVEHLKPVKAVFEFENIGDAPLTIISVTPQCGCTSKEFPTEPIMPGEKSKISLTYNAANKGFFNKSATVKTNSLKGNHILTIKGNVN